MGDSADKLSEIADDGRQITLRHGGRDIVSYHYGVCAVPEGVDPVYKRSGFLHPLLSPAGRVLTRIWPPDHRHHYGLWNPWTKAIIEGREADFWNLHRGLGTVRFAGFLSKTPGGFAARHEHVIFEPGGGEKAAIEERLEVRAGAGEAEGRLAWILDHTSTFRNVLSTEIELAQHRYGGGLCLRAPEAWTHDTCSVLTSEGKTRDEADGSRARWTDVRGVFEEGHAGGIVFLSHPGNREHPEPLRVWPSDANGGRGDLMFNITPIRLQRWTLEPGREHVLRYRLVVYDGAVSPGTAEALWCDFAGSTAGENPA